MHEPEINSYKELQQVVLLAAWDMEPAEAAARALEAEADNLPLMRALETAMAVCYIRAFTPSTLGTLSSQYVPSTRPDSDLHTWFQERRDKEYAHTDKKSSRVASVEVVGWEGGVVSVMLREQWDAFPRELIAPAIDLFQRQRDRLREDGTKIQVLLEGKEKFKGGS
jgi:hypothetical protein